MYIYIYTHLCIYIHIYTYKDVNIVLHWDATACSSDQGGALREFFNKRIALRFGEQVVGDTEGNPLQACTGHRNCLGVCIDMCKCWRCKVSVCVAFRKGWCVHAIVRQIGFTCCSRAAKKDSCIATHWFHALTYHHIIAHTFVVAKRLCTWAHIDFISSTHITHKCAP